MAQIPGKIAQFSERYRNFNKARTISSNARRINRNVITFPGTLAEVPET
jgi:hypothetical protein